MQTETAGRMVRWAAVRERPDGGPGRRTIACKELAWDFKVRSPATIWTILDDEDSEGDDADVK
jgi:hypothetical protein